MAREGLTAGAQAATTQRKVAGYHLAKLELLQGDLRLTTAGQNISYANEIYTGTGYLGRVSEVREGMDGQLVGMSLELSGLAQALVPQFLNPSDYFGRRGTVYFQIIDPDTHVATEPPFVLFRGKMDTMPFALGETVSITVTLESRHAAAQRKAVGRFTDADHRVRFPGDAFYSHVPAQQEKQLFWIRS